MSDPYRHPADRTCASSAAMLAAISTLAAMLLRRGVRR